MIFFVDLMGILIFLVGVFIGWKLEKFWEYVYNKEQGWWASLKEFFKEIW